MAKKSKIVKNERRKLIVDRFAARRWALKRIAIDQSQTHAARAEAIRALSRLPRDASPTRVRNRDQVDGRPRGYIGKAGLSRIRFRSASHAGELPGITKSSW
ncbi:MAG: 30S ribosomal protein S14 [Actinomycetota bacterium]|nr:30S ribosomal protein S14 [Actinomycetota bacterium]